MLCLDYEAVVDDPRRALARVADFIGSAADDCRWIEAAAAIPRRRPEKLSALAAGLSSELDAWSTAA